MAPRAAAAAIIPPTAATSGTAAAAAVEEAYEPGSLKHPCPLSSVQQ